MRSVTEIKQSKEADKSVRAKIVEFVYMNEGKAFSSTDVAKVLKLDLEQVRIAFYGLRQKERYEYEEKILNFKKINDNKSSQPTFYYWFE